MNNNTENIIDVEVLSDKEKKNKLKKKIIKYVSIFSAGIVGLSVVGGLAIFGIVKSNVKYTEQQAKDIALKQIPGKVVYVRKDLDLERFTLEYDVNIMDQNNIIREITIDSKYGAVSDFENYYYND
ncbi:MAG: PepSY domain-containing protein [Clostridium sp.]|nr:PepSY domain-containing protein [Clostridium sp.]